MSSATILHLTTPAALRHLEETGAYAPASLATEGFIHFSTPRQVLEVAERLFAGRRDLVVLVVDAARVDREIRYENLEGGSEAYPHVYGPVPAAAIRRVVPLGVDAAGRFVLPADLALPD